MKQEFSRDGCHMLQGAFSDEAVTALRNELSVFEGKPNSYGVRDLMNKVPYVKRMASTSPLIDIATEILGNNARPVRSVFFDKIEGANRKNQIQ
jgi:hypothetical protein